MPKYTFLCNSCNENFIVFLKINECENSNIICEMCKSTSVSRVFSFGGFNKSLTKEEVAEEIAAEVKDTVRKMKEGSLKHIRDIYGQKRS